MLQLRYTLRHYSGHQLREHATVTGTREACARFDDLVAEVEIHCLETSQAGGLGLGEVVALYGVDDQIVLWREIGR